MTGGDFYLRLFLVAGLLVAGTAPGLAASGHTATAAAAGQIEISGFGGGYTNAALRRLVAEGVRGAAADGKDAAAWQEARWHMSIETAAGNRGQIMIVARLAGPRACLRTGFMRTTGLGSAPDAVFMGSIARLARSLMAPTA